LKSQTLERKQPKHETIALAIRREIESGVLAHGMALASESQLCEQLRVSRGPVRQALAELQRQGLIRRQPGKGSFVHNPARVEPPPETAVRQLLVLLNAVGATPANFVAHELVDGLSRAVDEAGDRYRLNFQFHRSGAPIQPNSIPNCHGVVLAPFTFDAIRSFKQLAERLTMPVVSVYNRLDAEGVSQFYVDHEAGAFDATELLIRYGHRRIAMLGEPAISPGPAAAEREAGFLKAARAAGLPEGAAAFVRVGVEPLAARSIIENLLRQANRPTALVVAGGVITPMVLEAVRLVKLRVPHDLSIIAFDDTPEAAMNDPKLAVVKIPLIRLSRLGIDSLVAQQDHPARGRERASLGLKPELILSQSIGPAPAIE
jgi:DNA-binding LacI/PurR family transcriptional regulator